MAVHLRCRAWSPTRVKISTMPREQAGEPGPACESWSAAAAIFDELGDSVQAAEVRAEQDASGIC